MKRAQLIGFSVALGAAVLAYYITSVLVLPACADHCREKDR